MDFLSDLDFKTFMFVALEDLGLNIVFCGPMCLHIIFILNKKTGKYCGLLYFLGHLIIKISTWLKISLSLPQSTFFKWSGPKVFLIDLDSQCLRILNNISFSNCFVKYKLTFFNHFNEFNEKSFHYLSLGTEHHGLYIYWF